MKQNFLRRLGALALAFALALSLAPAAWAAPRDDEITSITVEPQTVKLGTNQSYDTSNLAVYANGQKDQRLSSDQYDLSIEQNDGVIRLLDGNLQAYEKEGTDFINVVLKSNTAIKASFTVIVGNPHETTGPGLKVTAPGAIVTDSTSNSIDILLALNSTITLKGEVTGDGMANAPLSYKLISGTSVQLGQYDINHIWDMSITAIAQGRTTIRASLYKDNQIVKTFDINVDVRDPEMRVTRDDTNETIASKKGTNEVSETVNLAQGKTLGVYGAIYIGTDRNEDVTWSSSNENIVKVAGGTNGKAVLTADPNNSGQATITATGHGMSASFYVNVPKPGVADVQSVTLNRSELRLGLDETFNLIATVQPSNADQTVRWESSPEGIVRVEDGKVTPLKVGEATITVTSTYNTTKKATCKVIVSPGLSSIAIQGKTGDRLTLGSGMSKPGQTQALEARVQPSNANYGAVTWTSDNTSVVTVRTNTQYTSGLFAILTSVGPGEAKITVKCGDVSDSATVTIPGLVLSGGVLTMTNGKLSMKEGETDQLTYKAYGQAATLTNVVPNWISSDSSVVDVDRLNGTITARKSGTSTITLELGSGGTYYEAKCEVTVVEDTSAIINAGTINAGAAYKFDRLVSQIQSVCSNKVGGTLSYINNLSVADTEQGILHDEHHSSDDTGAGVGIQDRYYRSANTSQGQRPLSDLSFVPRTTFNGTAEVSFTGWNTTGQPFNGLIRFTVNGTGDVMYASSEGEPVSFLASDFNFYHPNLKWVSFTPPQDSVGTLYYNYTNDKQPGTKVVSGTQYSRTGTPSIDKVTFVPASGYQGTARIAYKGADTSGRSITGVVTINVTPASGSSADPADISYSVRENSWVTLRAADFYNASRYTLGETLSYVRFTPPPSSEGTLFYNYRGFGNFDSMVNNTTSYYYSGNPALSGVTFVPTTTTPDRVDIDYTGYTTLGNTFEGTIHITVGDATEGGQQQLPLHYTVFTGRTVNLNVSDFNTVCRTATGADIASVQFTRLPGTSQGTLRYTRGNSSTANNVTTGIRFYRTGTGSSANLIGNVYFQAGSGTGTVTIPFTGTSTSGTTFTDEVTIVITPPTASEITYSGTTASPIRLSASRISSALSGAWNQSLSYITFNGLPSATAGHLYLGYNGVGTGTQVNTGTRYYASGYPSIDQISFVPRGRYNGPVSVGYTATSTSGQSVTGRIVFNISSTGSSSYFNDMAYHTWAAPSVDYLYQNQVTNGVTATTFGPNQRINRCDFVLMLCRAFKLSGSNGYSFADVPTNSYFSQAVATAKQLGIVNGDGGNFRPYGQVTRQDAMVMTYNALQAAGWNVGNASASVLNQFSDGSSVSSYARTAVSSLVQMGAVNGDNGRLLPHNSITRAEAAVILHFVMTM